MQHPTLEGIGEHLHFRESPRRWRGYLERSLPAPLPAMSVSLPRRHSWKSSRRFVTVIVVMMVMLRAVPCCSLEARCPPENDSKSYCQCTSEKIRSGLQVTIKCDFQKKEDVSLTQNLFPFRGSQALLASVQISNANSVEVTAGFLEAWLEVLSVGLDLWNCGAVKLATPPPVRLRLPHSFSTFVGVGLIGCKVQELPAKLLRDRMTASLRIKNSEVGTIRRGLLDNVQKLRYMVLEDSVVGEVEGPVATKGYINLHQLDEHSWNGLTLSNVTIQTLGSAAFNLTHKARKHENTHKVVVRDCQVGRVGGGAITVTGDIAVTIKHNFFGELEDQAFKISVDRDIKFEENVVRAARETALYGIRCGNLTRLDKNLINVKTDRYVNDLIHSSVSPFISSCRHSQVFKVVGSGSALTTTVTSYSTWVLLCVLLLLLLAAGGILLSWRAKNLQHSLGQNNFNSYNGVASSARYQVNQQEVNMLQSNPLYDRHGYSSAP